MGVAATQAACTGERADSRLQCPGFAERTENMPAMVVTLEVSQLEMFALKLKS